MSLDVANEKAHEWVLTLPVSIPDEEKKWAWIFILVQHSEMHGAERVKVNLCTEFCKSMSDYCNDDFPMKVNFQPNIDSYYWVTDVRLLYLIFIIKM